MKLFNGSKAQGLSLTTVVVAALALLVLIILSVIFVGRMARVSDKSKDCLQQGGICYNIDEGVSCSDHGDGLISHPNAQCLVDGPDNSRVVDETRICCIRSGV
jgi:hypothetical protein